MRCFEIRDHRSLQFCPVQNNADQTCHPWASFHVPRQSFVTGPVAASHFPLRRCCCSSRKTPSFPHSISPPHLFVIRGQRARPRRRRRGAPPLGRSRARRRAATRGRPAAAERRGERPAGPRSPAAGGGGKGEKPKQNPK